MIISGALDGLAPRHRAFANNLANIETPGFQPSDVPFEAQLRRLRDEMAENPASVDQPHPLALDPVPDNQKADRVDGNGVEVDRQVTLLAENTLAYEALAPAAQMRGAIFSSVVKPGST